ncbi:MAG: SpoIIE family protein phosphatase [Frankia sp.]|nr:SpoIIE family protein phosphatase [Frankia sp.]
MPDLELLAQMFDNAPIIFSVLDRDLRVRAVNQAWSRATGIPIDHAVGTRTPDWYPDVDPGHWTRLRYVLNNGRVIHDDVVAKHPGRDGPRLWRMTAYPLRDAAGDITAVGVAAVDVTEECRAQAERDRVLRQLRLLSQASRILGASLDLSRTLQELVRLVVPEFADVCGLMLADRPVALGSEPRRLLMRWVVWERSPHLPDLPAELARMNVNTEVDVTGSPFAAVITRRRPTLIDRTRHPRLPGPEELQHLTRFYRIRSTIAVPLLVGMECLGCVAFSVAGARRYSERDIETAMELGGRIAAAIANARAYELQQTAAITLQRALLPREIPPLPDLELVWRYHAGSGGTEVGGDWIDVLPLSAGRVALVIGDVMGHGLSAASAMGELRAASRTLTLLELPPAECVRKLNAIALGLNTIASVIYAVFDPGPRTLTFTNAGHLPPAMIRPDGTATLLDGADGILLGVAECATADNAFTERRFPFPPGSTLALYTDGVVESPTLDVSEGSRRLMRVLAEADDLGSAADRLLALYDRGAGYDDDASLLLVRAHPARQPAVPGRGPRRTGRRVSTRR